MKTSNSGGISRFNVSDALDVPLRGFLLRLRRTGGTPSVKDFSPGTQLRLTAPTGEQRVVTILAQSMTGGRNGQARMDKTGQIDLIISSEEAYADGVPVGIGWSAEGPLRDEQGRTTRGSLERPRRPGRRATKDAGSGGWPFNPPGGRHS